MKSIRCLPPIFIILFPVASMVATSAEAKAAPPPSISATTLYKHVSVTILFYYTELFLSFGRAPINHMMKIVIKEYTQWKTIIMPTTAVTTSVAPVEEVYHIGNSTMFCQNMSCMEAIYCTCSKSTFQKKVTRAKVQQYDAFFVC